MKKIFRGIAGVFALLFSFAFAGTVSFAEEPVVGEAIKEERVLTRLEIINEKFTGEKEVTRAEFAGLVCRALKLPKVDKTYFSDVPRTHYACGEINSLVEMNIISISSEGKFNPEDKITYEQACKMLVYATGYSEIAKFSEMGMKAYPIAARSIGFALTPQPAETLTRTEAIKLLFKAMTVNIARTQYFDNDNTTLFSKYHNVYYSKGQLRGINGWSLDDIKLAEDKISINGEVMFKDDTLNVDSLFGEDIGYIYIDDDGDKTVIFAEKIGENSILIESATITNFDSDSFSLNYENSSGRAKRVSIRKDAAICFNGSIYTKPLSVEFKKFIDGERKGTVKLINSKNSSGYDIVIIKSYETFILGAYDSGNKVYYDYCKNTQSFCIDDYEHVKVIDKNGKATTVPTSYPAPILLLRSEDKNFAEIIRFDEKTNINVTAIYDAERKILTDKGEYKVDGSNFNYVRGMIKIGGSYSVYVDIYNEILFSSYAKNDDRNVGFVRKVIFKKRDDESPLRFRIYCTDNVTREYKLAGKVKIDGKRYKGNECRDIILAFPGTNDFDLNAQTVTLERQLILFELNEEQEIKSIDTYKVSTEEKGVKENTLQLIDAGNYYYTQYVRKFGATMYVGDDVQYIVVPDVAADGTVLVDGIKVYEEDYMYGNKYKPEDWEVCNVEGYKFSDSSLAIDVVVIKAAVKNVSKTSYMYSKHIKTLNEDEEVCDNIICFSQGVERTFELDERLSISALSLNKGDIFAVNLDSDEKKIFSIEKQFNATTLGFERLGANTDPNRAYWYGSSPVPGSYGGIGDWRGSVYQLMKGYAYDIKGGVIGISYTLADAQKGIINERFGASSLKVTVYDMSNPGNSAYIGSISDIMTYKNAGSNCDLILLGNNGSQAQQIFVYKNYK